MLNVILKLTCICLVLCPGDQQEPTGRDVYANLFSQKTNICEFELSCSVISSMVLCEKWLLGAVQPAGSEAAVVCADGVCRLVRASTLQPGADVSVESRSQSAPSARSSASGKTSTWSAPVCSSSRSMDAHLYSVDAGKHPG